MPVITINDREVEFESGMTVFQVCKMLDIEVPHFCYHDKLSIAGNCRMCLVEISPGPPKPVASCAYPAENGMKVYTNTPSVKKAREGVMGFLLVNHPLDCPICDQGGECDLQDEAVIYGKDRGEPRKTKRSVVDKYMGPLIGTAMNRCIHCTRCVRFMSEVAGMPEVGLLNRGEYAEISSLDRAVTSELSGNLIDVCPVGALVSHPYLFKGRQWELKTVESIDTTDGLGAHTFLHVKDNRVMKVTPRRHDAINEVWISDRARFSYDALKSQRIDRPYVRNEEGSLIPSSWNEAFSAISVALKACDADSIYAFAGAQSDMESIYLLKQLMLRLGVVNVDCRVDGVHVDYRTPCSYLFNSTIAGIDEFESVLLVQTDLCKESPLIAARLRKAWLSGKLKNIFYVGTSCRFMFPVTHLGEDLSILEDLAEGKEKKISDALKNVSRAGIIVGGGALAFSDAQHVLHYLYRIATENNIITEGRSDFNFVHDVASRVGALWLKFVPSVGALGYLDFIASLSKPCEERKNSFAYLLEVDSQEIKRNEKTFIVYQGHHGDRGAHVADVILPGATFAEKDAWYMNMEGRLQSTARAICLPGDAKEDWSAILDLSRFLGLGLSYTDLKSVRSAILSEFFDSGVEEFIPVRVPWAKFGKEGKISGEKRKFMVENFYMTDSLTRSSLVMAECAGYFGKNEER